MADEYVKLEAEALRQYLKLDTAYRDAYRQLILFPVQAMANLYEMYYAQAMNHKLYKENNPQANEWADKVEQAFRRDAELCREYNEEMSGGKWNGMMTQKHIGYTSWNDDFPADRLPEVYRIEQPEGAVGGYLFTGDKGGGFYGGGALLYIIRCTEDRLDSHTAHGTYAERSGFDALYTVCGGGLRSLIK